MSFENAPISKCLMISVAVTSFLVGLFDVKHYFHLQLVPHLSKHHQYWRLFSHSLAFLNSSDLYLAELILYNTSTRLERQFGSVKFASYVIVSILVATTFEFLGLILFHRFGINGIYSGPATLIFSFLYQHSRLTPSIYHFRIFGVPLDNKSFIYLLSLQLAVGHWPGSILAALAGIAAGQIYRSDLVALKAYRLPPWLVRFSRKWLLPLIGPNRGGRRHIHAMPRENAEIRTENPEEVTVTTARAPRGTVPNLRMTAADAVTRLRATATGEGRQGQGQAARDPIGASISPPSAIREWMQELTPARGPTRMRAPTSGEATQLDNVFPDIPMETLVGALQQSQDIESAGEAFLNSGYSVIASNSEQHT